MRNEKLMKEIKKGGGIINCSHLMSFPLFFIMGTKRRISGEEAAGIDFTQLKESGWIDRQNGFPVKPWKDSDLTTIAYGKVYA